jgi:hypothetical protein
MVWQAGRRTGGQASPEQVAGKEKERMGRRRKPAADERAMLQELAEAITQQLAKGRSPKRVVTDLGLLGFNHRDAQRLVRTIAHGLPRAGRTPASAKRPAGERAPAVHPGIGRLATGALLAGSGGVIAYACLHAGQPPYFLVIPGAAVIAGLVESILAFRTSATPA